MFRILQLQRFSHINNVKQITCDESIQAIKISFSFLLGYKMFSTLAEKLKFFYEPYALIIVSVGYIVGELGHYLIGMP